MVKQTISLQFFEDTTSAPVLRYQHSTALQTSKLQPLNWNKDLKKFTRNKSVIFVLK